jgi:hypothetical protein
MPEELKTNVRVPVQSGVAIKKTLRQMSRWSDERLYRFIARRVIRLARTGALERRRRSLQPPGRSAVYGRLTSGPGSVRSIFGPKIDTRTLEALRRALRGEPSADLGEEWFERIWARIKGIVCRDWRLCEKIHDYDDEFLLLFALIGFILRSHGILLEMELITAACLLAWHRGPEWMCKCPKKPKKGNLSA